jgi:hypothetical protein
MASMDTWAALPGQWTKSVWSMSSWRRAPMARRGDPKVLRLVVAALRCHAEMTQEELADACGMSQGQFSRAPELAQEIQLTGLEGSRWPGAGLRARGGGSPGQGQQRGHEKQEDSAACSLVHGSSMESAPGRSLMAAWATPGKRGQR